MEKNFALCATKKINILTLVLSEKNILNETKNHTPTFKLNGWSFSTYFKFKFTFNYENYFKRQIDYHNRNFVIPKIIVVFTPSRHTTLFQRCFRLNFGHDVEQRWTNVVSTSNFHRLNRVALWRWLNVENRLILVKFVNVEL